MSSPSFIGQVAGKWLAPAWSPRGTPRSPSPRGQELGRPASREPGHSTPPAKWGKVSHPALQDAARGVASWTVAPGK